MFIIERTCTKVAAYGTSYWNGQKWVYFPLDAKAYSNDCTAKAVMTRMGFVNKQQVYFNVAVRG